MIIPEDRQVSNMIQTEQVVLMYLGIYMYKHIHTFIIKIGEKRSHGYEREQGGIYICLEGGKRWRNCAAI